MGVMVLFSLIAVHGQKIALNEKDVFTEFAQLGQMYKRVPLQLSIQIQNTANPVTTGADTIKTVIDMHLAPKSFYMQTEGLEEILNDSVLIMINNKTKEIKLFKSNQDIISRFGNAASMYMDDSSRTALEKKFTAELIAIDDNTNRIDLKSKVLVTGTVAPKETLSITYNKSNYQIIECSQRKTRLVPIDETVYSSLTGSSAFEGKLMRSAGASGDMYFLIKENSTNYKFLKVAYDLLSLPVLATDRIVKGTNGAYQPAKGFEEYSLNQQF